MAFKGIARQLWITSDAIHHVTKLVSVTSCPRKLHRRKYATHEKQDERRILNQPTTTQDLARIGGICSMYRLPQQTNTEDLDACFVGVPMDIGTCNRPGTRFGPRQIRVESVMTSHINSATGAEPFTCINVADVGDIKFNPYNLPEAIGDIKKGFAGLIANGCRTLAIGGDHTISYPILQAYKDKYGPLGLIHIDAHGDVEDTLTGAKVNHGTPFRRAVEENLIDGKRVVQIGIRFGVKDSLAWCLERGFRVIPAHHCWHKSLTPLMDDIRKYLGDGPVYLSFDIDGIDPAYAPGTGTPEIGGLTSIQALEIIRGCRGLDIVGCDLVEVSPPYDTSGNTSLIGASLLFEMLCILPGVTHPPPLL